MAGLMHVSSGQLGTACFARPCLDRLGWPSLTRRIVRPRLVSRVAHSGLGRTALVHRAYLAYSPKVPTLCVVRSAAATECHVVADQRRAAPPSATQQSTFPVRRLESCSGLHLDHLCAETTACRPTRGDATPTHINAVGIRLFGHGSAADEISTPQAGGPHRSKTGCDGQLPRSPSIARCKDMQFNPRDTPGCHHPVPFTEAGQEFLSNYDVIGIARAVLAPSRTSGTLRQRDACALRSSLESIAEYRKRSPRRKIPHRSNLTESSSRSRYRHSVRRHPSSINPNQLRQRNFNTVNDGDLRRVLTLYDNQGRMIVQRDPTIPRRHASRNRVFVFRRRVDG